MGSRYRDGDMPGSDELPGVRGGAELPLRKTRRRGTVADYLVDSGDVIDTDVDIERGFITNAQPSSTSIQLRGATGSNEEGTPRLDTSKATLQRILMRNRARDDVPSVVSW